MAAHIIVLLSPVDEGPGKRAVERIKQEYQNHYALSDNLIIVRSPDAAGPICRKVGMGEGEDEAVEGMVVKLNGAYQGYAEASLWDWLREEG